MRNVKILWTTNIILFVLVVLLLTLVMNNARQHPPDPIVEPPPDQVENEDKPPKEQQVIALIGDHQITRQQLNTKLLQRHGRELLEQMLDQIALQLESEALGIRVSEADVSQELQRMQSGYDDEQSFYRAMKEVGLDRTALQEEAYFKLLTEKIVTNGIVISDEWVDTYLAMHPEEFQSYVKWHIHIIVTPTKEQIEQIQAQLQAGSAFEELAREKSIDDVTRNDGGDYGWIEDGDPFIDAHILTTARQLAINQISDPIQLTTGEYAVVKISDRRDITKELTEQIRESIRKQLALQEAPPIHQIMTDLRQKYGQK